VFRQARIGAIKAFGKTKNHLEIIFQAEDNVETSARGRSVTAIGFFMDLETFKNKKGEQLQVGDSVDLIASMEKSHFRGRPELRLRIVDILQA
jgi:hypothetical protein